MWLPQQLHHMQSTIETLLVYKWWPIQILHFPILGVFIKVTFINSRKLLVLQLSTSTPQCPLFPAVPPCTALSLPPPTYSLLLLCPFTPSPPSEYFLFLLSRKIHDSPIALLVHCLLWVCGLQLIIHLIVTMNLEVNACHIHISELWLPYLTMIFFPILSVFCKILVIF